MILNHKFLLLFIPFFLTISCSNEEYDDFHKSISINQKLSLERVGEIVLHDSFENQHELGRLRFSFVSNLDNTLFAFYDEIKRHFIITNNEGVIQSVISGKGKGPGEVVSAGGYTFDEQNRLVVFDRGQMRITVFDLKGEVIKSSKVENKSYSFGGNKLYAFEGKIYTDIIEQVFLGDLEHAWKSKLVGIYNYEGELIDTIGKYDPFVKEAKSYLIFPIIDIDFENKFLISAQGSGFQMQMYNLISQSRVAWFGRKTSHYKVSDEYISPTLPRHKIKEKSLETSFPVSVHLLSDYIVFCFENVTESFFKTNNFNDKKAFISVYDTESYDFYTEIALPYILGNVAGNKFYLIEDDNPDNYTIGVYELKEKR